jgi:hypothetical protein
MILVVTETKEIVDASINPVIKYIQQAKTLCPELYQHFSERNNLSALDIGSSFPAPLICLYHNFNFSRFLAVDHYNESNCVQDFKRRNSAKEAPNFGDKTTSFFDLYNLCFVQSEGEKPMISSKDEFDKIFTNNFKLGTEIETYLEESNETFDFVVASNILHFFQKESHLKRVFYEVINKMKDDGTIYIRVQQKPHFNYPFFKELITATFEVGTLTETWDNNIFHSSNFINRTIT